MGEAVYSLDVSRRSAPSMNSSKDAVEVVQFDPYPQGSRPSRFSSRSTRAQWPDSKITLWPKARGSSG
jgi:hypothetical protein